MGTPVYGYTCCQVFKSDRRSAKLNDLCLNGESPKSDMTSKKEFMALNNINKGAQTNRSNHPVSHFPNFDQKHKLTGVQI